MCISPVPTTVTSASSFEDSAQALKDSHQKLQSELLVLSILPDLRPYLTDMEYFQVESKPGNRAQVDELLKILLTKGNWHFHEFCNTCEHRGYGHLAQQLRAAASGHMEAEGRHISLFMGTCMYL